MEREPYVVRTWLLLNTGRHERGHDSFLKCNFLLVYKWLTTAINCAIVQVTASFGTTVRWCLRLGLVILGMHTGWSDGRPCALDSSTIMVKGRLPSVAFHPSPLALLPYLCSQPQPSPLADVAGWGSRLALKSAPIYVSK